MNDWQSLYLGLSPCPAIVTTRIITCLVGDSEIPINLHFPLLKVDNPNYTMQVSNKLLSVIDVVHLQSRVDHRNPPDPLRVCRWTHGLEPMRNHGGYLAPSRTVKTPRVLFGSVDQQQLIAIVHVFDRFLVQDRVLDNVHTTFLLPISHPVHVNGPEPNCWGSLKNWLFWRKKFHSCCLQYCTSLSSVFMKMVRKNQQIYSQKKCDLQK